MGEISKDESVHPAIFFLGTEFVHKIFILSGLLVSPYLFETENNKPL